LFLMSRDGKSRFSPTRRVPTTSLIHLEGQNHLPFRMKALK
jgi:hypothetical protein